MKNPKIIEVIKEGAIYNLPLYKVTNEGLEDAGTKELLFCKGNKLDENVFRQEGFFTESIIQVAKMYLESVNTGDMKTNETTKAIEKLDEALMWINKRAEDRKLREVQGTYNK